MLMSLANGFRSLAPFFFFLGLVFVGLLLACISLGALYYCIRHSFYNPCETL
jgi:hypothetical protein